MSDNLQTDARPRRRRRRLRQLPDDRRTPTRTTRTPTVSATLCDNCRLDANPAQTDFDHDGEGDLCDLNDGAIYIMPSHLGDDGIEWQRELGCDQWNVYKGSIGRLRADAHLHAIPGTGGVALWVCGVTDTWYNETYAQSPFTAAFYLVSGVSGTTDLGLGTDSSGTTRLNTNPCP